MSVESPPAPPVSGLPTPAPSGSQGGALARLGIAVLAIVVLAIATHTTDLLVVVLALVVMIMIHELGHFATAKWSGMKVSEYFLGFGPRLWSVRRGETEYGIKALPLGGYVRILGMTNLEEVDPADEARTYRQQAFHKRLLVAVAGSAMHAVMAFVLLFSYLVIAGEPATVGAAINDVAAGSPAQAAGLHSGDVIVSVDGRRVTDLNSVTRLVGSMAGHQVALVVDRRGHDTTIDVTPAPVTVKKGTTTTTTGRIGVVIEAQTRNESLGMPVAVGRTFTIMGQTISLQVNALGQIFSAHGLSLYWHDLTNAKAAKASERSGLRIQSIYGAARSAVQGIQSGWTGFVEVMLSIILIIGMLNLLPMLPLDGGHVLVAVYERIRSRRGRPYHADVSKLAPATYAFVLFLAFVVLTAFYLDVAYPVANPFK
ncbi:MAG: M50 family metallopeptidase [Acidimicrobiales bacterium]